jgi:DUF2075 family protein
MFLILGRNSKYVHITDYITIKSGNFDEVWGFFTYCKEFLEKEEAGIAENFEGNYISVHKVMGAKGLMIYGEGDDDSGYTGFNLKVLNKVLTCMQEWRKPL